MMSLNEFSEIAGIVQSIVITIAVIVGGGWTLYQFISLNSIAKSKAELEAIKINIDSSPPFEVTIKHETIAYPKKSDKCLLFTISVKNIGNRLGMLDRSTAVLYATQVLLENNQTIKALTKDKIKAFHHLDNPRYPLSFIGNGEVAELPFVLPLSRTGIYLINFSIATSRHTKDELSKIENSYGEAIVSSGEVIAQKIIYAQ